MEYSENMRIFFKNEEQEDQLKRFMIENGIEWETEIPIAEDAKTNYNVLDLSLFEITPDDIRNIEKGIQESMDGQNIPLKTVEAEIDHRLSEIDQQLDAGKH